MRIDLLEAFGLDTNVIAILKHKYGAQLLLWPGPMNYDGSNKPYDRQISDHKRRCIAQIKKGIAGKIDAVPGELETLIFTRPKVGYMLNVGKEDVASLFRVIGSDIFEGEGSRISVVFNKRVLNIHKPHPSGEMKKYAVEKVRDFLNIIGIKP